MAVTAVAYNKFKQKILNQANVIDLDDAGTTVKVALMTSSYTPNIDTDEFWSSISANEASGTNYTAGGQALTTKAVGLDTSGDFGYFDSDDPIWVNVTITARYAVYYKDTGVAGTSPLISYVNFGADQSPAGVDFRIIQPATAAGAILKTA